MAYSRSCLLVAVHVLHDEGMHDVSMVDKADDHAVAAHVGNDEDVHEILSSCRSCLLAAVHVLHDESMHEVSMIHEAAIVL